MTESNVLHKLLGDQLSVWPLAAANYRAVKTAQLRKMQVGGLEVTVQHNPGRVNSVLASSEKPSREQCVLCEKNRPKAQQIIRFEARKGRK